MNELFMKLLSKQHGNFYQLRNKKITECSLEAWETYYHIGKQEFDSPLCLNDTPFVRDCIHDFWIHDPSIPIVRSTQVVILDLLEGMHWALTCDLTTKDLRNNDVWYEQMHQVLICVTHRISQLACKKWRLKILNSEEHRDIKHFKLDQLNSNESLLDEVEIDDEEDAVKKHFEQNKENMKKRNR